jgi:HK97 family phage prohead protease
MELPNLITLSDGRPGLRTLLQVETREPSGSVTGDGGRVTGNSEPASEGSPSSPVASHPSPVLDFIASTDTLDRYHEIIDPAGWRLDGYRRNPVFQNAHNYGDILFTIGKALVTEVRSGSSPQLYQRVQFATDVNPMARIAYGLYKGGFLNAVSVGFIPIRWENGAPDAPFRRKYLEQELLEVSAVAIPANPDALALGLKAGAIHKSDLRELASIASAAVGATPSVDVGREQNQGQYLTFARTLREILRHT